MSFTVDFGVISTAYAWGLLLLGAAALTIFARHAESFVKVVLIHVYLWLKITEQFSDSSKATAIRHHKKRLSNLRQESRRCILQHRAS